ncbi:hypothetical protein Fmac_026357 [Flemingia macrophylla]|uniref:Disease resistance R13L4/SHOC-2-like LRR domain-containing protein n=1 Tax=Flemingia macrophylla TaxID=520843 RepID=A0ABD1LF61_9FABA
MLEFSAKLSYNLLESEEIQQTFLIYACMGQDTLISDLVRYYISLGLLQGIDAVREARDRVHKLVARLKELSLLSESFSSRCFTMQSLIRDAALLIASQKMPVFALTKEKLEKWQDKDKLGSYSTISLQHCDVTDIINEFHEGIDSFTVRIFHLDNKDPHLRIPEGIFTGMKELRVLTLTDTPLPSSIKCLTKLRMLCLERCTLGKKLSYLGELKELRVLSLSGSNIERLPNQLSQLAKLQIFDITNFFELKEIPPDVLSSLTSLEGLYVGNNPIQWNDEE